MPTTFSELNEEFSRIEIAPGATETINGLNEGNFNLAVALTEDVEDAETAPDFLVPVGMDDFSTVVPVVADATTEVDVIFAGSTFTGFEFSNVVITEDEH